MDFHVFKSKKKKPTPEPKAPAPKEAQPPAPPSSSKLPPLPRRPMPSIGAGAYMDELDRMSRVPGMRNFEVTTSRTFRWNLRDPVDGCDYEYCYQDQGPQMAHWGGMQRPPIGYSMAQGLPPRPPRQLLGPPPEYQYGPPGPMVGSSQPHYDYGYGGVPSAYGYPGAGGGGYYDDDYPQDCSVM